MKESEKIPQKLLALIEDIRRLTDYVRVSRPSVGEITLSRAQSQILTAYPWAAQLHGVWPGKYPGHWSYQEFTLIAR